MKKYIFFLATMATLAACSDDDSLNSAQMVIDKVYLEDAKATDGVTDREVSFARLGQTLRIEGSGFTGLKHIYINGYDNYFNNALMTDNNVWVTLNSNIPVAKATEDVRNKITFTKDALTTTKEFTIRASSPIITGINNTLPSAGEEVTVIGQNLENTSKVVLPDGTEVGDDQITSAEDGTSFSFTMPAGVKQVSGAITTEGVNGQAVSPAMFNNNDCYIINFDGKGEQGSWSATFSADDLVDDPLNSGRGKVIKIIPDSYLAENPDGVKAGVDHIKGFYTAGNDSPDDDWTRMKKFIPGTTPVDSVALQFDVYCPEGWNNSGQIEFTLQNNLSNYGYGSGGTKYNKDYKNQAYAWVPWFNRETGDTLKTFKTEGWETITIPLSSFGNYTNSELTWTFQNVIDDKNAGSYRNLGVLFCNPDITWKDDAGKEKTLPAQDFNLPIYIDNLRIVPITTRTISDF